MCRHAAYTGPGIALSELTLDLDHCLLRQSHQAKELLTGTVCADGFAVGWYDPDTRQEPARYASALPIWADTNLPSFGPVVRSGMVMAAVRNATVAGTTNEVNCAPFADGRFLLSHNGFLEDFDAAWKDSLREWISPARRRRIRGATDSEHLFQALLARLDEAGNESGAAATTVQGFLRDVVALGRKLDRSAHLNLLLTDGRRIIATRAGTGTPQNSLYLLTDGQEFPDAHVVASEPLYDDPAWAPIAEDSIVVLEAGAPPVRMRV